MKQIPQTLILGALSIAMLLAPAATLAEVHSRSKEIVVMESHDLPEIAQLPGNSLFLHSDNAGDTYLYIEQQKGARISVFDVTDPGRIRLASTTGLDSSEAFDFVGPLNDEAELVRFRNDNHVAVLDLHKARKPQLQTIAALTSITLMEHLGETGVLAMNVPYTYLPAVPRDFQVLDVSTASAPALLTTIKDVKHRVVNDETGTTFLLSSDGLTVVRRLNVENDFKAQQVRMQGN